MDIKIAGGTFRGKKLVIPETFQDFRPTKSMVREAVCSSIQADISGANALELCAGSGVFSFELISRGATKVTAVELSEQRAAFISTTASQMGVEKKLSVINESVIAYLKRLSKTETHDIIFFDPPYYIDALTDVVPVALQHLSDYGVLIFEYATDDMYAQSLAVPEGFEARRKRYGKSTIQYFRKSEE